MRERPEQNRPLMRLREIGLTLLLVTATALAYWPAYRGQFIWDDDRHISRNTLLQSTRGLQRIWFDVGATPQYYPLTHTTFWIEWQLWGDNVVGYHAVNIALHALASLLLVRLLKRLSVQGAWLAGFVFALHPLHVESVAWMSERKNTLSIVFWLAAILVYSRVAGLIGKPAKGWHWWGAFGLFVSAVLSKTITCTMPAVMLVLIWWKRGRLTWRDVRPLIGFFVVALVAAMVTGRMERDVVGAEGDDWSLSLVERTLVAARALWWYAGKVVCPTSLAFSYERWSVDLGSMGQWTFVVATVVFVAVLWLARKRVGRAPLAAALIFGGTLFPALGYFNLFPHRYSYVADHFQYHSDVAAIGLLCGVLTLVARRVPPWARYAWCGTLIALLGTMTLAQSRIYRDQETLWRDTIARTPTSWLAHHNLAIYLASMRADPATLDESLALLRRTKELRPQHERVEWSIADLLRRMGREQEAQTHYAAAIEQYRQLIHRDPGAPNAYARLASLYDTIGRSEDALDVYLEAAIAIPSNPYFVQQSVMRLVQSQRVRQAIPLMERWTMLEPDRFEPRIRLAYAYGVTGRSVEAREQFKEAARIDPFNPEVVRGFNLAEKSILLTPATVPAPGDGMPPE